MVILLSLIAINGCWSTDDGLFGPDDLVERDGYAVGHKTYRYDRGDRMQNRFSRAASSGSRPDYNQREIKELLDYHNTLRTQVSPSAANMEYMVN